MSASLNHTGLPPLTAAERNREYRQRRSAAGMPVRGGRSGKGGRKASLFEAGQFVAVDGEGFSEGPERVWRVGASRREYRGRLHNYALLAASDGSEIYSETRLSTKACLDFLCDIKINNPMAIIVCFGGSYDVCQMLAHGLSKAQIAELIRNGKDGDGSKGSRRTLDFSLTENGVTHDYRLELRQRKSLSIWRWEGGTEKYRRTHDKDGNMKWVMNDCAKATLWDVWGFFQDSFVGVMQKWIPDDPDYQFIRKNKGDRNIFERSEIETIRRYNQAEVRCLVEIMNKVREAIKGLDLQITRWDGAGAIAAAMLKFHDVKQHMAPTPVHVPRGASASVMLAASHAYSGGHIEVCQMGYHDGEIFHYDVNSAYPDQFRNLPALSAGKWRHGMCGAGDIPPAGFTLVKVAYDFHDGNSFYPLFFREESGAIIYPQRGCGWYWYPEYEAAREYSLRLGAHQFVPLEFWHFSSPIQVYPFRWAEDYYARRQSLVAEAKRSGVPNGEEKIIKLGLNSLYGKTVQQVGARVDEDGEIVQPPYFQLEWGGYVTAGCRAKLMQAALQNPTAIIGFATDGLFSTEALDLDCPAEKILGAWEFEKHDGITMVMPGVYWLHEEGKKPKHYSRGFDKTQMSDAEFIHRAWARKTEYLPIDTTRLIGLGSACVSDSFWQMRGMFVSGTRELALNGDNSKRYPVMLYKEKPHLRLVPTVPRDHLYDLLTPLIEILSEPYEIAWMKPDVPETDEHVLGEKYEESEIMDAELA